MRRSSKSWRPSAERRRQHSEATASPGRPRTLAGTHGKCIPRPNPFRNRESSFNPRNRASCSCPVPTTNSIAVNADPARANHGGVAPQRKIGLGAAGISLDFVEGLHHFHERDGISYRHDIADLFERRLVRRGSAVERAGEGRSNLMGHSSDFQSSPLGKWPTPPPAPFARRVRWPLHPAYRNVRRSFRRGWAGSCRQLW